MGTTPTPRTRERRSTRVTTVLAAVIVLVVLLISPRLGIWLALLAALWAILSATTTKRRQQGRSLIQTYWWILVLWAVCGIAVLATQVFG